MTFQEWFQSLIANKPMQMPIQQPQQSPWMNVAPTPAPTPGPESFGMNAGHIQEVMARAKKQK